MIKEDIYLICNNATLYANKRLLAESQKSVINLIPLRPYDQNIRHSDQLVAPKPCKVLFRSYGTDYDDYDLLVARSLVQNKCDVINPIDSIKSFRDKNWQAQILEELCINSVPTFSVRKHNSLDILSEYKEEQSFVVKTQRGYGGNGVFLLDNKDAMIKFLKEKEQLKDLKYIVQPYIEEKLELRAFIIKDQIVEILSKEITGKSFKGNKGDSEAKVFTSSIKIKKDIEEIIKKLNYFNLSYYAIDLFLINNELLTLEVNLSPGFETIEKLTKLNIAKKILTTLS